MSKLAIKVDIEYCLRMEKIQTLFVSCTMHFTFMSLLTLASCTTPIAQPSNDLKQPTPPARIAKQEPSEVTVMTYNVENLFDNHHDENREDYSYLSLGKKLEPAVAAFCRSITNTRYRKECEQLDYSDEVVDIKLNSIAHVIRAVDLGHGPDILMMAEVENESILQRLVSEKLQGLGYQTIVLLEGPDVRGIDPAFISKFPLAEKPMLHLIPYSEKDPEQLKWARRSRGILEVTVTLPSNKKLTFMIAHFPAQMNPVDWRKQAVLFAKKLLQERLDQGRSVIFGGDLNITGEEEAQYGFFKNDFSSVGLVSHLVGCEKCLGTHNFKGGWSFLDVLIYSKNLSQTGYNLIPDSIEVVRTEENMKKNGAPLAFRADGKKSKGVSDHFPLFSRLKLLK